MEVRLLTDRESGLAEAYTPLIGKRYLLRFGYLSPKVRKLSIYKNWI